MRKSYKKALGLLGLATVVGMTSVAANLPTPAGAVSGVTDVISVTVVDRLTPSVKLTGITNGSNFTNPVVEFTVDYANLKTISVSLKRKGGDSTPIFANIFNYENRSGTKELTINLTEYGGYGDYSILIEGDGYEGGVANDSVSFRYYQETTQDGKDIVEDEKGNPIIDLSGLTDGHKAVIEVYKKDSEDPFLEGIEVTEGGKITLPFTDNNATSGRYIITITEYDADGRILLVKHIEYIYTPLVPKTGSPLANLNISRADYLSSGLIIFGLALIFAFVFLRKKKGSGRR